jgi:hypothetical protein
VLHTLLLLLLLLLLVCLSLQVRSQQAIHWLHSVHWQQRRVPLRVVLLLLLLLLLLVVACLVQCWRSCWVRDWVQQQLQQRQQQNLTLQRIWLQCCSSCRHLFHMCLQLRGRPMLQQCSTSWGCCTPGMLATGQRTWSRCR